MTTLVFDNTPLSHFARAGALPVLENITASFRRIAPAEVIRELIRGTSLHPALAAAVSLPWIEIAELIEIEEIVAFARYKAELGGGTERNNGEAAALAWAGVHGGIASSMSGPERAPPGVTTSKSTAPSGLSPMRYEAASCQRTKRSV